MNYPRLSSLIFLLLLMSCDKDSGSSLLSDVDSALERRSRELFASMEDRLDQTHREAKGSTWNTTQLVLNPGWFLPSTDKLWNSPSSARPATEPCKPGSNHCHPQFSRKLCSTDADCGDKALLCAPLQATVFRLGQTPDSVCQYPSDGLIDALYTSLTRAHEQLDITSLSAPDGMFHEAFINALSIVSQQSDHVRVRILYSGEIVGNLNIFQPPKRYLERVQKDIAKRMGRPDSLHFNVAWLGRGLSWNHTKIIIADNSFGLQGGHNWWDGDYLGMTSVYDLSMYYQGEALYDSTVFIDKLWSVVPKSLAYYPNDEKFPPFAEGFATETTGDVPAISLGRLGVYGDNSADEAMAALIDSAEEELLISQQDMYNITNLLPIGRSYVEENLFQAVLRDVKVFIIQSNKQGLDYGMIPPDKAIHSLRKDFEAYVKHNKIFLPPDVNVKKFFCDRVFYAPHRYSDWTNWWNKGPLSLHAKLVIADRAAFYLGSQNLYPSNLQEFGLAVFDARRTAEILDQYWQHAYSASQSARSSCL